jgi:probable DNA metabolism protein
LENGTLGVIDKKPLATPADIVFVYDGSFNGFLCCVHESVYSGKIPTDILVEEPITLFDVAYIETDELIAQRVLESIPKKISGDTLNLIKTVFLSCLKQKELHMLKFLLRGYREGGSIVKKLGDPDTAVLLKAERHLRREAHLLTGFIRFSDYDGALAATITPKNYILPFLTRHFVLRYDDEDFIIFDKTHKAALVYHKAEGAKKRRLEIIKLDNIEFPAISEDESKFRALWKRFYDTVAIEARTNPRCRMTHMPKRYWENMPEMADQCF